MVKYWDWEDKNQKDLLIAITLFFLIGEWLILPGFFESLFSSFKKLLDVSIFLLALNLTSHLKTPKSWKHNNFFFGVKLKFDCLKHWKDDGWFIKCCNS